MAKKKCPYCGKEANIIPFGNRFIAVCCSQIIYVGHESPSGDESDIMSDDLNIRPAN